jgi:hypothetical protein
LTGNRGPLAKNGCKKKIKNALFKQKNNRLLSKLDGPAFENATFWDTKTNFQYLTIGRKGIGCP